MNISGIYLKQDDALQSPESRSEALLERGVGFAGDSDVNNLNPMQILITTTEAMDSSAFKNIALKRSYILLSGISIDQLHSGDAIISGKTILRLTYGCENCSLRGTTVGHCIYAIVSRGGVIRTNDSVNHAANLFAPLPQTRYGRFLWFMKQVPLGKVVTYHQAVTAIGGTRAHLRSLPQFIKKATSSQQNPPFPFHRLVDSQKQPIVHVPGQLDLLKSEGVGFDRNGKVRDDYLWEPCPLFDLPEETDYE